MILETKLYIIRPGIPKMWAAILLSILSEILESFSGLSLLNKTNIVGDSSYLWLN